MNFLLPNDVKAFLVRATASLERIDLLVEEAIRLVRNANDLVNEFRDQGIRVTPSKKS